MSFTRSLLIVPALLAGSALVLAGCSGTATADSTAGADGVTVVASTNVYAQIVSELAGDAVTVEAIISSSAQDPHSYEATAADQLTVEGADLIVENGGGYDSFMDSLVTASGSTAPVIVASEYSHDWPGNDGHDHSDEETATAEATESATDDHDHTDEDSATDDATDSSDDHDGHDHVEGFNEHVWYDPHTMAHLAEAVSEQLTALLPDDAATFEANLAAFTAQISEMETQLSDIAASYSGAEVFVTEPVPGYLVAAAGLTNVTPSEFSEAVEEGQDVPPATLLEAINLLEGGTVSVVIANAQTGGAETTQVIDTAETAGIPVLEFTETLPEGQTYIQWMTQNIEELAGALAQ